MGASESIDTEFTGLSAIVTGGASGIGKAVTELLLARGAKVAVFDLNPDAAPAGALGIKCDVSDRDSVNAAVESAAGEFGGIDIVINNAGIGAQGQVDANDDAEWNKVLNVNVVSVARVTAAALPHLRQSEHGAVVNTASIAATAGLPERVLYSATKGAIYSMTLAMAADHIHEGIRVNAVCPGTANTPWVTGGLLSKAENPEEELRQLNARQPHGRLVEPTEVARTIAFLASPLQGSTTGTAVAVDGGMQGLRLRD
ncbi:SDR family NAD(P)-dependent oxidoreductase [Brevibacterium moorei]|uniref:SDR family NAD(P)-dependent oxidoreductase n=1 Tax=Brevibacterium moorei TaxID=2968457 RepID=UPI00211BC8A4|nr:SDR family oxidoreductase [Brevibacterium sp. 68QC2CO]MCQ9385433.1 SDR family oxidoreductase [Brevibacterium sp. 68QC2CO]